MSAVGLSDLYRYGTRFVGYGLVVTAAGGAFVAGGYVLGATDISPQVASNEALLGIAAGAIGVLLALSGLVGLVYKLIADAVMAGTAAALSAQTADAEEPAAANEPTEESETEDATKAVPAAAPADDEPDAPADESSPPAEPEPTAEEPTQPTAEAEQDIEEPEPTTEPEEATQPTAEAEQDIEESQPTADAEASAVDDGGEPVAEESQPVEETADEQSETATAESVDLFEGAEETAAEDREAEAPPQEWSPPDPSEFERSESVEPSVDDDETDDTPDDDGETSEAPDDDETDGAAGDEFDGWDTPESESDASSPRTAADLFGDSGEVDSTEQSAEETGTQSDKRLIDDDDTDGEETLADEGVEGFDVDSDSDPLSDALDDE